MTVTLLKDVYMSLTLPNGPMRDFDLGKGSV